MNLPCQYATFPNGMNKYLWLTVLIVSASDMETDFGCCEKSNGYCIECCENYHFLDEMCQVCPLGFHGVRCRKECGYPWYGKLCSSICNCSKAECHSALGCLSYDKDTIASSTFNMIPSTSYNEKQVNSLVTTSERSHVSTDSENTYKTANTSKETEPHLGHEPHLFLFVKILGVALGISVIIILGLICLFLYNKRQRNLMSLQQHQFYW